MGELKTYRIRKEMIKICDYLEFKYKRTNEDRYIFDNVFKYSLDYIIKKGFNLEIEEYKGLRNVKGFTVETDTCKLLKKTLDFLRLKFKLQVGEFIELLIYIYVRDHLNEDEQKMLEVEKLNIYER